MTRQRARTYAWLVVALVASVAINLFFLQPADRHVAASASQSRQAAGGPAGTLRVALAASEGSSQGTSLGTNRETNPEANRGPGQVTVRAVQRELKLAGYYPGQIDGRVSYLTHAAVYAFEHEHGLPLTAEPSQTVLQALILGPGRRSATGGQVARVVKGSAAERLLRDIQIKLSDLGYAAGTADGRLTVPLISAIRAFEADNGLEPTGHVSAGLLMYLHRSTANFRSSRG